MVKVVNLRRARKNLERAQRQATAVQARAKSGRTLSQRASDAAEMAETDRAARQMDGLRLTGSETEES